MNHYIIKLNRVKHMPVKVIIRKILVKISSTIYYIIRKRYLNFKPINLNDKYFSSFIPNNQFIFEDKSEDFYITELKRYGLCDDIIKEADKICSHVFNFLGLNDYSIGSNIKWNEDFKSGFTWNNNFYKFIITENLNNFADVKVPWELSRFQHIFTLGKAYWITQDEKYAIEFKNQIKDWIKKNPVEMSINWTCTMDVSIRAINWITGYYFFSKSKSIEKDFWILLNKNLYMHGLFIFNNLENTANHTNNHYLSNLAGLIWLGIYFEEFKIKEKSSKNNSREWLSFGLDEFEKEMDTQVNEDGTSYEAATSYHKLVTEIFLITSILCNKNEIYFSDIFNKKLEKMCQFILDISDCTGIAPLIGDADDGRLLIFSNYYGWNRKDFSYLLSIAGEYFNRHEFKEIGRNHKEDVLWNFKKINSYYENNTDIKFFKSIAYRKGGFYILRNKNIKCIIRCGELSVRGQGGHSHNDQLSFSLSINDHEFIIDPGLYVYTSDYRMRNLFRSTKMHNTVAINDYEQNRFNSYELFAMKEETFGECIKFNDNEFVGKHYGYLSKLNAVHERRIYLQDKCINIFDKIIDNCNLELETNNDQNNLEVYTYLHFTKEIEIDFQDKKCILSNGYIKICLNLKNCKKLIADNYFYSDSYGVLKEGKYLKILVDDINNELNISLTLIE